ncbi:MAG TPA: cyclodeaminase/cyclohydrolase family protein [Thermoanaerobacterales bacterium]|nr:cyclodeaminase/cyclohydrolase family protein [Thermoanaerobacterales bacterium]
MKGVITEVVNSSIKQFLDILASEQPAPGGGAVSALVGAVGTALLSMVANLTLGKQKFKENEHLVQELLEEASKLQKDLTRLITEDTEAFNKVAEVFKMPKNTEQEKSKRKEKMQVALKFATQVPFTIMEKTVEALCLHEKSLGHTNPSAISDTGVGALCLKAALKGAWLNVKINLNSITDKEFVQNKAEKAQKLLNEGALLADKVYEAVLQSL